MNPHPNAYTHARLRPGDSTHSPATYGTMLMPGDGTKLSQIHSLITTTPQTTYDLAKLAGINTACAAMLLNELARTGRIKPGCVRRNRRLVGTWFLGGEKECSD